MLPLLLSTFFTSSEADVVPLTMLSLEEHPKAKCLDGSPAGYYAEQASNPDDKLKWVIYLNGGGECDTQSQCAEKAETSKLGSSKFFKNESDATDWFLASNHCPSNPTLCTWNRVQDPYCSQDMHSGTRTEPSAETWGYYFAGHHVLTAILDEMDKAPFNMVDATDIIVSGSSAGGLGVWTNVDYVAQRYPHARVTAATVAGFYFYATYYDGPNATTAEDIADFREAGIERAYTLYDSHVDADCKEAHESKGKSAAPCLLSNISFPYVESDSFVAQSQTDQVVLKHHDCWPEEYMEEEPEAAFMAQWHQNMTVALEPLMQSRGRAGGSSPRNGVFSAACYTHTGFNHMHPKIEGVTYLTAFTNFYFNRTGQEMYKLQDDCGEMCNPTCDL